MTSSSDTFPFGIADVVELLGLTGSPQEESKGTPPHQVCGAGH